MRREHIKVGMEVYFGSPNGQQTLGRVEKVNPKKAKVVTLEGRGYKDKTGVVWNVPFSLMKPADKNWVAPELPMSITDIVIDMAGIERHKQEKDKDREAREDVYFLGKCKVNGKELPFQLHLIRGHGWGNNKDWSGSFELGHNEKNKYETHRRCKKCNGEDADEIGSGTGLLPLRLWSAIVPIMDDEGYKMHTSDSKRPWFVFQHEVPLLSESEPTHRRGGRFFGYTEWRQQIDCPLCGRHVQVEREAAGI